MDRESGDLTYHGMISSIEEGDNGRMVELGSFDTLKEAADSVLRRGKARNEVIRLESEGQILYLLAGAVTRGGTFPQECCWETEVGYRYELMADHPSPLTLIDDWD